MLVFRVCRNPHCIQITWIGTLHPQQPIVHIVILGIETDRKAERNGSHSGPSFVRTVLRSSGRPIVWPPFRRGLHHPCNWSFPGEKPFSGLLKNSSEIWNVTEKLGEPLSLFVHSQTLPTVFSCYNLLGLIVIEMSIFVRNACRTNSSPRFWSFH